MLAVVGAQSMIKKGIDKRINKTRGCPSLYEMHKIKLCGTTYLFKRLISM